ncbi:MAG: BMP family ABC transporter substrate-binding protein [Thermodesulfobacteriota bacterium]
MNRLLLTVVLLSAFLPAFPPPAAAAQPLKVALVTDVGKVDDHTFNEFAYKGMLKAAEEFGLKTSYIETLQPTDYEKNIEQFVNEGFAVIITVGFMLGDATKRLAEKYPDKKFIIVEFAYDPPLPNVMGLLFAGDQSGFLGGALAGLMTRSKTVGIVAGKEIPPVVAFRRGYEAGVKYVCPDCQVLGVYIDSFTDPARGKTAALSQMDEGADVIFGAGGVTGSGAILGAAQAGAWVIGVDQDEYLTTFQEGRAEGAARVLSSAMKRIDVAVYDAVKMAVTDQFQGGAKVYDAAIDGVGLAPFHDAQPAIPAPVQAKLEEIAGGLKTGAIKTGVE